MAQLMIFPRHVIPCSSMVFVLTYLMSAPHLLAQSLIDPTRPSTLVGESATNDARLAGPVLQSILIGPNRHVAVISGQTVALNGKFGEQTLIKMSETEVVLRNGKEFQTLRLFPDFNKKPIKASGK
jgi:MSHA biogenesis protein MshK